MSSTEPAEAEAPVVDQVREAVLAELGARLGDGLVESHLEPGVDLWLRVTRESWADAARVCKDAGFTYFCFLSAVDWMPSPYGKGDEDPDAEPKARDTTVEQGVAGGDTRFQLLARVESPVRHIGVTLKADLPDDDLVAPTWSAVYPGAEWHESETWEMYGLNFDGHPGLRHMYLPGDFEGHPLRKDFPLIARMVKPWPGLVDVEPMPGEDADDDEGDATAEETG